MKSTIELLETKNLEALHDGIVRQRTKVGVAYLAGFSAFLEYPKDTKEYEKAVMRRDKTLVFIKTVLKKRGEVFTTLEKRMLNNILFMHSKAKEKSKD